MGHNHYETKEDLLLPWIKCLWCNYKDKVERDLGWHILEKHKYQLRKLGDDYYFLYNTEVLIDDAIKLGRVKLESC
jgi:hypothetical protein